MFYFYIFWIFSGKKFQFCSPENVEMTFCVFTTLDETIFSAFSSPLKQLSTTVEVDHVKAFPTAIGGAKAGWKKISQSLIGITRTSVLLTYMLLFSMASRTVKMDGRPLFTGQIPLTRISSDSRLHLKLCTSFPINSVYVWTTIGQATFHQASFHWRRYVRR